MRLFCLIALAVELQSLVGNEGGFVHKKLLGIGRTALGILPGGGLIKTGLETAIGVITRSTRRTPVLLPPVSTRIPLAIKFPELAGGGLGLATSVTRTLREFKQCMAAAGGNLSLCLSEQAKLAAARLAGGNGGTGTGVPCDPPLVKGPLGLCIERTSPLGASRLGGEATMGQYGAALIPGSQIVDRATCIRGMQLGNDGLCYNKGQISNKQRMWPAGRKPLLSGGDMRAISIAARAGRRMELATKRLQKMGMMKKPVRRQLAPHAHARAARDVVSV